MTNDQLKIVLNYLSSIEAKLENIDERLNWIDKKFENIKDGVIESLKNSEDIKELRIEVNSLKDEGEM